MLCLGGMDISLGGQGDDTINVGDAHVLQIFRAVRLISRLGMLSVTIKIEKSLQLKSVVAVPEHLVENFGEYYIQGTQS